MSQEDDIFGYHYTWGTRTITGTGFGSPIEAEMALWRALDAFGYTKPRWFEFWRWSEVAPSYRVMNNLHHSEGE